MEDVAVDVAKVVVCVDVTDVEVTEVEKDEEGDVVAEDVVVSEVVAVVAGDVEGVLEIVVVGVDVINGVVLDV